MLIVYRTVRIGKHISSGPLRGAVSAVRMAFRPAAFFLYNPIFVFLLPPFCDKVICGYVCLEIYIYRDLLNKEEVLYGI